MAVMDTNAPPVEDLPRTLRREREARERASRSRFTAMDPTLPPSAPFVPEPIGGEHALATGTTVTDIRIPFPRLVMFCLKLVFAAIPALILLGGLLWLAGHLLLTFAPWLLKLQILIQVPR